MSRHVEREIVVQAPADTVYTVWRNFETFPNFMDNIDEVREIGYGRSHWKAKGPLGREAEWEAEITRDEPGHAIAWRSIDTPESNVRTEGSVEFESLGDATRVCVRMNYEAGAVGDLAARIFTHPEHQVEEDLRRFKDMIEQPAYRRSTEAVAGHGTPQSDLRVNPSVDVFPEQAQAQGKYPKTDAMHDEAPRGPGHPDEQPGRERDTARPTTTSTPGGTLGAPTEGQLKEDQSAKSERESRY